MLKHSLTFFIASAAVVLAGFVFMGINGAQGKGAFEYSLEFKGGTSTNVTFNEDYSIEEIDELIGKELPEGDYETLAGYIMDELQCIPKDGEMNEVVFENVKFTVLSVEDRRIEKIKVEITPVVEQDDESDDD